MSHQDAPAEHPSSRRPQLLAALGRCLTALAVYVGVMALLILRSHAQTDPAERAGYPFLTPVFLAWWVAFPLVAGLWVRTLWWAPVAWLGPLLLRPVESRLMGEQAAAAIAMVGLATGLVGAAIGKWAFRPGRGWWRGA